jgi:hypothetical protein
MATVRVSKRTYEKLSNLAGRMRRKFGRLVSIDEAFKSAMKTDGLKPSDYSGTLMLDDSEADEISEGLSRFWS